MVKLASRVAERATAWQVERTGAQIEQLTVSVASLMGAATLAGVLRQTADVGAARAGAWGVAYNAAMTFLL